MIHDTREHCHSFSGERLSPTNNAYYQNDRECMDGTRARVNNDGVLWATKSLIQDMPSNGFDADGMLWIYGMPGIGKSAIAHSICSRLDAMKQLGGCFFCIRDDSARSDIKSVLPTLICELAGMSGPYRNCLVKALREGPATYTAVGKWRAFPELPAISRSTSTRGISIGDRCPRRVWSPGYPQATSGTPIESIQPEQVVQ